ncbi:hypothetical protein LIA77_02610 [Sarocladium implicatum]|nr:hypothetical protein LIA77_02610 [Sarocladium implicatum]
MREDGEQKEAGQTRQGRRGSRREERWQWVAVGGSGHRSQCRVQSYGSTERAHRGLAASQPIGGRAVLVDSGSLGRRYGRRNCGEQPRAEGTWGQRYVAMAVEVPRTIWGLVSGRVYKQRSAAAKSVGHEALRVGFSQRGGRNSHCSSGEGPGAIWGYPTGPVPLLGCRQETLQRICERRQSWGRWEPY